MSDGSPEYVAQPESPNRGPIEVEAEPGADSVALTVKFLKDMEDVEIEVRGIQRVVVQSEGWPVRNAVFRSGQKAKLKVDYTGGPGDSYLDVIVRWREGSRRQTVGRMVNLGN